MSKLGKPCSLLYKVDGFMLQGMEARVRSWGTPKQSLVVVGHGRHSMGGEWGT